jgi:hypothetical protein
MGVRKVCVGLVLSHYGNACDDTGEDRVGCCFSCLSWCLVDNIHFLLDSLSWLGPLFMVMYVLVDMITRCSLYYVFATWRDCVFEVMWKWNGCRWCFISKWCDGFREFISLISVFFHIYIKNVMDFTRRRDYVDGEFHIFFDGEEFILMLLLIFN